MISERSRTVWRGVLTISGALSVIYSLAVLGFVATAPDIGLRCLLENGSGTANVGLQVRQIVSAGRDSLVGPQPGDELVAIGDLSARTFVHFTACMAALRNAEYPGGKLLVESESDLKNNWDNLPPVVRLNDERSFVKIRYLHDGEEFRAWLPLRPIPWQDIALTLIWFALVSGIFAVGALSFWARPFDRQSRVFFAMCTVSMGGFVGGFHWWIVAESLVLTIPFIVCAMLVPVVTLHFFLVYPEPKPLVARFPLGSALALYTVPALWTVALAGLAVYSTWIFLHAPQDPQVEKVLSLLNEGIHVYLGIAAAYFAAALGALANSFFTTRNPILHNQVKWILWAAVVATLPVGYSLSLAYFQKEKFALGAATVPMFVASLLFMLAYAVGILRYKLMLVDEIVSRGMVYYVLNVGVTFVFSLAIVASSLAGMYQYVKVPRHVSVVIALVVLAVLLLNWARDRVQRLIDRKFFREKFQLDKALQRMNEAAGGFGDPNVLAQRMLASCRDLLGVDRAALYLRDASGGEFRLIAAEGIDAAPLVLEGDEEVLGLLRGESGTLRIDSEAGGTESQSRQLLQELDVELVHALEFEGSPAGVLLLGGKRNGERYTAEDLALLASLGQITGVALNSARVQQAVSQLNDELRLKVEKIGEQQRLIAMLQAEITSRQQVAAPVEELPFRRDLIKGSSSAIARVLETVRKVSGSQSSVLIRGESGTGKELLAAAIHENSPRRGGAMVSVHCGALSAGLLESELFGHVKGAFTGAHRDKIGRFELAHGGTLFLDEIGDISLDTQVKLLRVLQEREFEPVGGTRTIEVDVRLITATHQNLERLIAEGRFREDLFYRLNVISISLPPLRERGDDIIELALYFLNRSAERAGKRISHLDESALDALRQYPWPGNIRELENAIERSVVMAEGLAITLHDLPATIVAGGARPARILEAKPVPAPIDLPAASTAVAAREMSSRQAELQGERQALVDALARSNGNKAEAARLLGIPRSTFFSRLKKFQLDT